MTRKLLTLPMLFALSLCAKANVPADSAEIYQKAFDPFRDSINKTLNYSVGKIKPEGGHIMLDVPGEFKYLNKEQSKYVLTKLWDNPESGPVEYPVE